MPDTLTPPMTDSCFRTTSRNEARYNRDIVRTYGGGFVADHPDWFFDRLTVAGLTTRGYEPRPDYISHVGEAFAMAQQFFRSHGSGRYSNRTLNALRERSRNPASASGDTLYAIGAPYSYDEMTEAKQGGILGMCWVTNPNDEGAAFAHIVVKDSVRRKGIARAFDAVARCEVTGLAYRVARTNAQGMRTLVNLGYSPDSVSSTGVVVMTYAGLDAIPYDLPADTPYQTLRVNDDFWLDND